MFCPKCGQLLTYTLDERLVCAAGKMEFTQHLTSKFEECYLAQTRNPREMKFNFVVGGEWYCPVCGVSAKEEDGHIRCPKCNRSLNEFIYQLIERHPHNEVHGWR